MQMKSKMLKKWNLPSYGKKLDQITSKPYLFLLLLALCGVVLFLWGHAVIGVVVVVTAGYQFCVGQNLILCEFYDQYAVFYPEAGSDECFLLFWEDVAGWQYQSGWMHDTLKILLKDGNSVEFASLCRRKMEHYFRQCAHIEPSPVPKQHV